MLGNSIVVFFGVIVFGIVTHVTLNIADVMPVTGSYDALSTGQPLFSLETILVLALHLHGVDMGNVSLGAIDGITLACVSALLGDRKAGVKRKSYLWFIPFG